MSKTKRERFQHLLTEYKRELGILPLQVALEEEVLDLHRERFPRRKAARKRVPLKRGEGRWGAICKLAEKAFPEEFQEICERHREAAREKRKKHEARKQEIGAELDKLAEELEPQPGNDWIKVREVCSSDYHTQGFGAASYARGSAERHCAMIKFQSIEAEVREREGDTFKSHYPFQTSRTIIYFEVWAKCSKLDYEIAKHRPAMTLKEQLQWYWNRSLNPRVFNPFLPHGIEEKLGVSFQPVRDAEGNLSP